MKKRTLIISVFILMLSIQAGTESRFYKKHRKAVTDQHSSDIANRDAVLKQLNSFIGGINGEVSKENNVMLSTPVMEKHIEGVTEITHFHTTGAIPPAIYGYASVSNLNMRTDDSGSGEIIGRLSFREEVEILYQSDRTSTVGGAKAPWLLIRRANRDEGWVWGGYLSDRKPSKEGKQEITTDWNIIMPASGRISSRFGYRVDPITRRRKSFHKGIDIAAPKGTPVYAAEAGTVHMAKYVRYGYGNLIVLKHSSDFSTYYGHLSKILVSKNNRIKKGDLIGRVGTTGRSTGPHLHFEVRKGNKALNPEQYIK